MFCRICDSKEEEESEKHLLKCAKLVKHLDKNIDIANARYENIFSEKIEDQVSITKVYHSIFKIRFKLINETLS